MSDNTDFAALIGSRICHDLISPVGAIGNGLELIALTGDAKGPEMQLIADSVQNANARIRYFRIAFGQPGAEQTVAESEIISVLQALAPSSRVQIDWAVSGGVPRPQLRIAFLAIMCVESAMPFGGTLVVHCEQERWTLTGETEKLRADATYWQPLAQGQIAADLPPAKVQFGLLTSGANALDRNVAVDIQETRLTLAF